jgi:ribose-phosphate pyrophosphokinase
VASIKRTLHSKIQDVVMANLALFTGNSNPALAAEIAHHLGLSVSNSVVSQFSDGEINVEITDNVRGRGGFVLQSTCAPTNNNLMELVLMIDALRRASAGRITAVVPYFGYARQDRRVRSVRVPISAKVVADMINNVGVTRVVTVDLHSEQIQGFFDCAVENVYGAPVLLSDIEKQNYQDLIVVSPDIGGVVRARAVAKQLNTDLAVIDKRRPEANQAQVMNIIGDVAGRTCLLVDDIVDTAGTLCSAANALKKAGAKQVVSYCTHPVLSGAALENLDNSQLDTLVVANSIPLSEAARMNPKIRQLSMGHMLAEAIRRVSNEESISAMFD